jgi:chromosomal replication initiator protein
MKVWEDFLQTQVKSLGSEAIDKWAKSLKVVFFDAGNLYLEAQDSFQVGWFEEHLRPQIRQSFRNNNHRMIKVHLSMAGAPSPKDKKIWKPILNLAGDSIHPSCRLETYFTGQANLTSFSLLKESLEKMIYNPIYLHGPSGSGKTHLLMAAYTYLTEQKKQCFYVTASTLTNHIVAAMRTGGMQKLRELYRQHDVLLVDDVHQLAHRSATQEELFHTFNTLHVAGKQIILAGSGLPSLLEGIEPRLTSRFEWGLVLPLQALTVQEQKEFCQSRSKELSKEVEEFLLNHLTSVKSLQSALDTISLRKGKNEVTVSLIQKWIQPLLEDQKRKALTPEKVIQATAETFEIPAADILGRSQNQGCSLPRQVAMYLCRLMLKMPYLKIAAVFSRDHSTVMTSVKCIDKKIGEQDDSMLSTMNSIKLKLKS